MEDDLWWSVFGRVAAPILFFLIGFVQGRTVPLHWIWLGVVLTLLESWNADLTWVAPALIRIARPYGQILMQRDGWGGFFVIVRGILAVLPITSKIVDYGSEGWLWALCGQRMYVDSRTVVDAHGATQNSAPLVPAITENMVLMCLLACIVAAAGRNKGNTCFLNFHLAAVILGVGILSISLCLFQRGPSRIQPPEAMVGFLRFISRHTLEIYAIQLAGSELLIKLVPDLAA